ncbi:MAG TPA: hypothetical protein VNY36_07140, partial [Bacteroidia bacterium]|nr:hypothetical protein [Bacteroidia bacterium]
MAIDKTKVGPKFLSTFVETFGLSCDELTYLLSHFEARNLRKKDIYLRAGDITNQKAYINKGCTRTYVMDEAGRERILFFSFEDWWIADFESDYSGQPGYS